MIPIDCKSKSNWLYNPKLKLGELAAKGLISRRERVAPNSRAEDALRFLIVHTYGSS